MLLAVTLAAGALASSEPVAAEEVKVGIAFGFTGPIESLIPPMAAAAELAISEVSSSGLLLGGSRAVAVRADTTCVDSAAANAAAERLVTAEGVRGIVGAACSGASGAILQKVARPNGVVMISPSSTSPALSAAEDDGLFFRTSPSDARQAKVITDVLTDRGIKAVALTYTNNDYGNGLADSFRAAFRAAGGAVTVSSSHEDGKGDYSAEIATLHAAGGDALVVAGYIDQGGLGIVRGAIDTDAFRTFALCDGMIGESLVANIGPDLDGSFGQVPGTDSPGAARMAELGRANGFEADRPFAPEAYDAAALILLAMQAAGSSDPADYKGTVLDVANAPGEEIYPGELAKALRILAAGGEVNYVGGSAVELIGPGESAGNYREVEVRNGKFETVRYR